MVISILIYAYVEIMKCHAIVTYSGAFNAQDCHGILDESSRSR